jgi:putative NADH-flavin reductase
MKIALIGATGFVGSVILKGALDRGHEVTVIARDPEKVKPHPKLRPQKADVSNTDEVLISTHPVKTGDTNGFDSKLHIEQE